MVSKVAFDLKLIHLLTLKFTPVYLSVSGKEFDSGFYLVLSTQYHKTIKSL